MSRNSLAVLFGVMLFVSQASAKDWKLVWSDEFNYQGLPDPNKWGCEEGFVRNEEQQYYTHARMENARVEIRHTNGGQEGVLVIEGRKEKFKNPKYNPQRSKDWRNREYAEYTSASLITLNKASWQYGRVEVRAKLPQGQGVWPAIWMMGTNIGQVGWPACGEIDIMEFVGHTPNTVYANIHYSKDGRHKSGGGKIDANQPFGNFHIYAIEWYPDRMEYFFDDNKYFTYDLKQADEKGENPFRKPQYLLMNLALGGDWGGKIDDNILPQQYLIDYVRVYQKVSEAGDK
jgi:beta-glucanase (GH16 family)